MRVSHWRILLPILISLALVANVVWRISPEKLAAAAVQLDWPPLVALTILFVLALYFWDAFCLRWLFAQPDLSLSYGTALHARGCSYLFSAVNYGLGQGALAWHFARVQNLPLVSALGRLVVLLCHDLVVLLAMGFLASLSSDQAEVVAVRLVCLVGLGILTVLLVSACLMPQGFRERLRATKWGIWLSWWSVRRSVHLCLLRACHFSIIVAYAAIGLALCRVQVDQRVICSAVPLVVLVEGLPISMSGLGTREQSMLLLLGSQDRSTVAAFSLIWSAGLIGGRALLGLGHWTRMAR